MSETKKTFMGKIVGVLTTPGRAFNDIEEGDLWKGVLIILFVAILSAIAGNIYATKMEFTLPESITGPGGPFSQQGVDPTAFRSMMVIAMAIGNAIGVVLRWLVLSVLVIVVARIFGGNGGKKRMFSMTAFASIPLIIQQLLRIIDAAGVSGETLQSFDPMKALGDPMAQKLIYRTLSVFTVFGIWAFILTILAVSVNYQRSRGRAAAMTLIAYLVYIVIGLYISI